MVRLLLTLLAFSLVVPASAEEKIFRAEKIDMEQNARLSKLEDRDNETELQLAKLQKSIDDLAESLKPEPTVAQSVRDAPKPVADPVPNAIDPPEKQYCIGDVKYCENGLHYLGCIDGVETWLPVPLAAQSVARSTLRYSEPVVTYSQPATVQRSVTTTSTRYSTSEIQTQIRQQRPGGWRGPVYADVQPRSAAKQHLTGEHGYTWDQVNGLSFDEALILHDLRHGGKVSPYRSGQSIQASASSPYIPPQPMQLQAAYQPEQSRIVRRAPVANMIQAVGSGCANGQCAQGASSQSVRYGLFGWRR